MGWVKIYPNKVGVMDRFMDIDKNCHPLIDSERGRLESQAKLQISNS